MAESSQGPDGILPATNLTTSSVREPVKLRLGDADVFATTPVSVVTAFSKVAQECPDNIAIVDSYNDVEEMYTYKRYYESVVHVAKAFIKLGMQPHEGVGIIGHNSPQWFISHLSSIFAGGVSAGLYVRDSADAIYTVIEKAECSVIVVEDTEQLQKVLKVSRSLTQVKAIVQYRGELVTKRTNVYTWDEILEMNVDDCEDELERRISNIAPNKCCTVISTSGTTGKAKLVMLSHDNIIWTVNTYQACANEGKTFPPVSIMSFQPLNTARVLLSDVYLPMLSNGGTTYIAQPGEFLKTLKTVRPTVLLTPTKTWEAIMESALQYEESSHTIKKQFLSWARNVGYSKYLSEQSGSDNPPMFGIAKHLALTKMTKEIGLDRCRLAISGGVPCKKNVLKFFQGLDISILDSYGMTECAGISINLPSNNKIGTSGRTLPGTQVKLRRIFEENTGDEIMCSGRSVFMGYLKDESGTLKAFDKEMWFHTQDLGSMTEDGFLKIYGRIQDLVILKTGSCINPYPIENRILKNLPCLRHCVLVGECGQYLSVLLVVKTERKSTGKPTKVLHPTVLTWLNSIGSDAVKLSQLTKSRDPRVTRAIQEAIDKVNEKALSDKERIRKWTILPKYFSIAGGELTRSLKVRREEVFKIYEEEIREMYEY